MCEIQSSDHSGRGGGATGMSHLIPQLPWNPGGSLTGFLPASGRALAIRVRQGQGGPGVLGNWQSWEEKQCPFTFRLQDSQVASPAQWLLAGVGPWILAPSPSPSSAPAPRAGVGLNFNPCLIRSNPVSLQLARARPSPPPPAAPPSRRGRSGDSVCLSGSVCPCGPSTPGWGRNQEAPGALPPPPGVLQAA